MSKAAEMLEALAPIAPDAFCSTATIAAAKVVADEENPLRLNLCCAAVRILFEHVMGTMAPSVEVEKCSWYSPHKGESAPVRAQRIQYWMQGGLTDDFLDRELEIDPRPLRKRLLAAFNDLSKHVHGRQATVITDANEIELRATEIAEAVRELFNSYHDCRTALIEPLLELLDESAVDSLMAETIESIDELASHHSIEEIYTEHTVVEAITATTVRYRSSGSISVVLQWGSNSDLRRGDGAEMEKGFPFSCSFEVPIDDPHDLSNAEVASGVDTSAWWDRYYDDDDFA
jgi:hypothetical protein